MIYYNGKAQGIGESGSDVTVAVTAPSDTSGLWVNSNTGVAYYYNGTQWTEIGGSTSDLVVWSDNELQTVVNNNWK